jgi:hypothetical protein
MGNIFDELDTCMKCNENAVDTLELYCQHCSLELLAEAMENSEILDQLWLTKENA